MIKKIQYYFHWFVKIINGQEKWRYVNDINTDYKMTSI